MGTSEAKLSQRVDGAEGQIRDTSAKTATNTQAIEANQKSIQGLDGRVSEVNTVATDAKKKAESASEAVRDADTRLQALSTRVANRNKYAMVETKTVYFDFNKADLRDEGINELEEVAKALQAAGSGALAKEALYEMGVICLSTGKRDDALRHFSRILEQDIGFRDVAARIEQMKA